MGKKKDKYNHGFDHIVIGEANHELGEFLATCTRCSFNYRFKGFEDGLFRLKDFDQVGLKHREYEVCMKAYDRGVKFSKEDMFHSYQGSLSFTATPESASFIKGFEDGLGRQVTLEGEFNGVKDVVTVSW